MFVEIKHTLRRVRGAIIGWGIGLFLYGLLMSSFYSSLEIMGEDYLEMLEGFPQEMLAFFPSINEITSPPGYLDTYYFSYMTLIVGIFAIGTCAGLLVGDEEKGILDLVMAHPVSRTNLFFGRLVGFVLATAAILAIGWIGWVIPSQSSGLELSAIELLQPQLPLLVILVLFGSLALLLSMVLPSGRSAAGLTGALLVANFFLIGIASINTDLQPLYEVTPLYFYQGGKAVEGIDWGAFIGLLGVSVVFALVAWWRFQRRDIRVGGEGGWRLSLPAVFQRG